LPSPALPGFGSDFSSNFGERYWECFGNDIGCLLVSFYGRDIGIVYGSVYGSVFRSVDGSYFGDIWNVIPKVMGHLVNGHVCVMMMQQYLSFSLLQLWVFPLEDLFHFCCLFEAAPRPRS
jgi:hypothetical protein